MLAKECIFYWETPWLLPWWITASRLKIYKALMLRNYNSLSNKAPTDAQTWNSALYTIGLEVESEWAPNRTSSQDVGNVNATSQNIHRGMRSIL